MHDAFIISNLSCPDLSVPCSAEALGEAMWEHFRHALQSLTLFALR